MCGEHTKVRVCDGKAGLPEGGAPAQDGEHGRAPLGQMACGCSPAPETHLPSPQPPPEGAPLANSHSFPSSGGRWPRWVTGVRGARAPEPQTAPLIPVHWPLGSRERRARGLLPPLALSQKWLQWPCPASGFLPLRLCHPCVGVPLSSLPQRGCPAGRCSCRPLDTEGWLGPPASVPPSLGQMQRTSC